MPKILIIEDHTGIRSNIVEQLSLEGFEVVATPSGAMGIDTARDQIPDLIICDIMMPNVNGYDVLKEVRANPATAHTPFIFLTSLTTESDIRKGMELGADYYLTKPYTPSKLLMMVNMALQGKSE